jgi:hypothetical protein
MSIEHLRNLAKYGVIADQDPYSLPPEAFSGGVNVRFRNGKITSGPVFRNALALGTTDPRFAFSSNPTTGLDFLFVGYKDGTVSRISGSSESPYSITSYTPSAVDATWSSANLAGVTYVNRSDRAPWYLRTTDSIFQNLGLSGWPSLTQAGLLRTCGGALVALNVTKAGVQYPTMVKTSSIPLAGAVPASWDITLPNTLALENILAELQGPIVDACSLGNDLIIYGYKQAYHMQPNGSLSVYNFTPLPFQKGALNANCSVEMDGKNVVFGPDDIWQHDGVSEKSICDGRVRDYIYGSINQSKSNLCFVTHNPKLKEITFAYASGDGLIYFSGANGCNRQAVWNYSDDTWSFDDLPFVFSSCPANLSNPVTYTSIGSTVFDAFGGSYQDQEDGYKRTPVYVGASNATFGLATTLYAFDLYGQGSTVAYPVVTAATAPRYLERDGIDLDELNADLRGYKTLASIYPQARLGSASAPLTIAAGGSNSFNVPAVIGAYQPYNGDDLYKLDFNTAGRWLALRIKYSDYKEMAIVGLDLDLFITGKR